MSKQKLKRAPAFLRQSGPKVEANTVRVYRHGKILRISNDLMQELVPDYERQSFLNLVPFVGEDQTLVLKVAKKDERGALLRTWQSSPESRSVLVSLAGLLTLLELSEATAPGSYRAEVKEDSLMIYFTSKLTSKLA